MHVKKKRVTQIKILLTKVKNTVDASQSNSITYLTNFKGVPPLTKIKNLLNQI